MYYAPIKATGETKSSFIARLKILYLHGKTTYPGADVMVTILCDFCQFSAKKFNVMIEFLQKLGVV
jgi:hypothetical protein